MQADGIEGVAAGAIGDARAALAAERATVQLDLLPTPEQVIDARRGLGEGFDAVDAHKAARRGRPAGARNKRTDDFARYILGFGQDPAITLMQISSAAPEVLIEASRQSKVHSFRRDGTPNMVIERMTYEAAQHLRRQCAAELMPFIHGKMPVAVDLTIQQRMPLLVIEGLTATADEARELAAGEFELLPDDWAETAQNGASPDADREPLE